MAAQPLTITQIKLHLSNAIAARDWQHVEQVARMLDDLEAKLNHQGRQPEVLPAEEQVFDQYTDALRNARPTQTGMLQLRQAFNALENS
jgi:hypothetical protein